MFGHQRNGKKTYYDRDRGHSGGNELDKFAVWLKNVYTAYPRSKDAALRDITISIPYKTIILITGPNGSGKTTFLELILGFLKPLTGEIYVLGNKMPRNARKVRLSMSYLPQDFMRESTEPYSVWDVVLMGLAAYGKPFGIISQDDEERIRWAIRVVGLEGLEDRPIGQLSGGQQQRAMLARAIVRKPKLLLLDEPFSSLDPEGREHVSEILKTLREEFGTTILVVSHVIEPLVNYADCVIELREGRVVREEWIS